MVLSAKLSEFRTQSNVCRRLWVSSVQILVDFASAISPGRGRPGPGGSSLSTNHTVSTNITHLPLQSQCSPITAARAPRATHNIPRSRHTTPSKFIIAIKKEAPITFVTTHHSRAPPTASWAHPCLAHTARTPHNHDGPEQRVAALSRRRLNSNWRWKLW